VHLLFTDGEREERALSCAHLQSMWVLHGQEMLAWLAMNDATIATFGTGREGFDAVPAAAIGDLQDFEALLKTPVRYLDGRLLGSISTPWQKDRSPVESIPHRALDVSRQHAVVILAHNAAERRRAEHRLLDIESFMRSFIDMLETHLAILDAAGHIVAANKAWRNLGFHGAGMVADCLAQLRDGTAQTFGHEGRCELPAGPRWFAISATRLPGEAGQRFVVTREDITPRKLAEQQLLLHAQVIEASHEGIFILDRRHRVVSVNRAFCEITGYTQADCLGKPPSLLDSGRHDDTFHRHLWSLIRRNRHWEGEIWHRRKNGEVFPVWLSITRVRDQAEAPVHYVGIYSDITERKASEHRIRYLAHYDLLTDLPNRVLLGDRFAMAIEYPASSPFSSWTWTASSWSMIRWATLRETSF